MLNSGSSSWITRLRQLKQPVYKSFVIAHGKQLLCAHEAALKFAKVDEQGEYVRHPEGGLEWDEMKWDHWFCRRLLGELGEATVGSRRACPRPPCGPAGSSP